MVKLVHFIAGVLSLILLVALQYSMLATGNWKQNTALLGVYAIGLVFWLYVQHDRRATFEKVCNDMKAKYGYSDEVDAEIRELAKRTNP